MHNCVSISQNESSCGPDLSLKMSNKERYLEDKEETWYFSQMSAQLLIRWSYL